MDKMFKWTTLVTWTIWTSLMCVPPTQSQMCERCAIGQTCRLVRGFPTCVSDGIPIVNPNPIAMNTRISQLDQLTPMQGQQRGGSVQLVQEPSSFPQPTITGANVGGLRRTNIRNAPIFPPVARTPPDFERTGQGQAPPSDTRRSQTPSSSWIGGSDQIPGRRDQPVQRGNLRMREEVQNRGNAGTDIGNTTTPAPLIQPARESRLSIIEKDQFGLYYMYYVENKPGKRVNITKSGFCSPPRRRSRTSRFLCFNICESDSGCPGRFKCCPNDCALSCVRPTYRRSGQGHGRDGHHGHSTDGHQGHLHGADGHQGHGHGRDRHQGQGHSRDRHQGHGRDRHQGHGHGRNRHQGQHTEQTWPTQPQGRRGSMFGT